MADESSKPPPWNAGQARKPTPWEGGSDPTDDEAGDRESEAPAGDDPPLDRGATPGSRPVMAARRAGPRPSNAPGAIKPATTPARKNALRFFAPVLLFLIGMSLFNPFANHAAIANYVRLNSGMGFDSGMLDGIEELCEQEGIGLAKDGVQGWVTGEDKRWVIVAHVRCWAFMVIPYGQHFRFSDELPDDGHTQRHLDNFVRDGWYFDRAIIEAYREESTSPDAPEYAQKAEGSIQAPP